MESIPWVRCASGNVFSRAHFFCFPEVCRAQSWTACRLTLWKYGWKDEKYLWAPKSETAAVSPLALWGPLKVLHPLQTFAAVAAAVWLFGAHKYLSSFQPYFQRVGRQAEQLWARQTSGKQKKWAREKKPSSLSQTRCQCASVALTGTKFDPKTAEKAPPF